MMRIGQERLRGVAAMAGLANDTAVQPRRRLRRARGAERSAATRVSPCAVRKPGQAGWGDRQAPRAAYQQQAQLPAASGASGQTRSAALRASLSTCNSILGDSLSSSTQWPR